jgi:hypothetical protein
MIGSPLPSVPILRAVHGTSLRRGSSAAAVAGLRAFAPVRSPARRLRHYRRTHLSHADRGRVERRR